jgi:hypothetical protein
VKERHEVGEGDDTITIEDTSDEEDGSAMVQIQPTWTASYPPY